MIVEHDIDPEQYADLAHALWSVTQAVVGHRGHFTVEVDGNSSSKELNDRWKQHGRDIPWR